MSHRLIHNHLRKHIPEGVEKAKKIFRFRYPKLFLLSTIIISSYFLFSNPIFSKWISSIKLGDFGVFMSGAMTSFGFTAPIGFGWLSKMSVPNILIAAIIGSIGATLVDLFIFKTIKFSFKKEFDKLEKTKVMRKIEKIVKKNKHVLIVHYLLFIFAGIIIASPLPDEIGVPILAGLTTIKPVMLAIIGFILHGLGIFLVLSLL
jgi:hypothetical protein